MGLQEDMYIQRFASKHKSSNKPYHNLQNYSSTTHSHRNVSTAHIKLRLVVMCSQP